MATPATQGAPSAGPRAASAVAGPQTAERLRAIVLGPRGGGTTRRRASDAFRLGFAAAAVAVSIPVIQANSAIELSIVHALNPPPTAIRWLVTAAFWGGSFGVVAALAAVGLLVPRLVAVRRIAEAAAVTWVLCVLLELAGSVLSQVLVALALGAALHAVGERASIATLLIVITLASMIGGAVPVPGGAGVVEAGLIAGLTGAGVPQDQAVAAVFIQRLFTAYLPPIWGRVTLAWMRRREYV